MLELVWGSRVKSSARGRERRSERLTGAAPENRQEGPHGDRHEDKVHGEDLGTFLESVDERAIGDGRARTLSICRRGARSRSSRKLIEKLSLSESAMAASCEAVYSSRQREGEGGQSSILGRHGLRRPGRLR